MKKKLSYGVYKGLNVVGRSESLEYAYRLAEGLAQHKNNIIVRDDHKQETLITFKQGKAEFKSHYARMYFKNIELNSTKQTGFVL